MRVPGFLNNAYNFQMEHLSKEKLFFTKFSLLAEPDELGIISNESEMAYENFKKELNNVEKSLKLIV